MPTEEQDVHTTSESNEPSKSQTVSESHGDSSLVTCSSSDKKIACLSTDSKPEVPSSDSANGTFPSEFVENGSDTNRFDMQDSLLEDSQISTESGEGSSLPGNTLDDISSLKTVEENASPIQNEADIINESDIGQIETHLAPSSLKEPPERNGEEEEEREEGDNEEYEGEDGWMDVIGSGDLMKKLIRKGKGISTRPQRGNVATINIVGYLEDGQEVEIERGKKVTVGDAEVIQGLDLAIPLMEVDEICEIIIKPRLGYGKLGREPDIPPHATITYQVELLAVDDDPDPEQMPFAERKRIGDSKREKGNFWYSRREYSCALQCYRRALDFLDDSSNDFKNATEEQKILADTWMKVSNNMAATQLKIGAFDAALKSVENVLKVQPNNVKALFRKGKILAAIGKTEEAVSTMKDALKLEPETKIIHQELSLLVAKQKTEVKTEREMYKRMLGQDKQNPAKAQQSSSTNSFLKLGLLAGGITVAILSIVAYRHLHSGSIE